MPKVCGLNVVAILAGSVAFFMLGWVWYGMLFMEQWTSLSGITINPNKEMNPAEMAYGFINCVVVTIGLGLLLKWLNVSKLLTAVKYGVMACVFFALTTDAYGFIYGGQPFELFVLNGGYNLVGYALVAAIWSFFD